MESINLQEGTVITVTELKQTLGKYMDLVEAQNEVVITKNGKKTARLTPYITDLEQYFLVRTGFERSIRWEKVSYEEFMGRSMKYFTDGVH